MPSCCRLSQEVSTDVYKVSRIYYVFLFLPQIYHRIPNSDPCSTKTRQIISTIRTQNLPNCQLVSRSHYSPIYLSFVMLLAALSWQYLSTMSQVTEDYVQTGEH